LERLGNRQPANSDPLAAAYERFARVDALRVLSLFEMTPLTEKAAYNEPPLNM
jgi:hypothetical protein